MTELAQRIAAWLLVHPGAKTSDVAKAFSITMDEALRVMQQIAWEPLYNNRGKKGLE